MTSNRPIELSRLTNVSPNDSLENSFDEGDLSAARPRESHIRSPFLDEDVFDDFGEQIVSESEFIAFCLLETDPKELYHKLQTRQELLARHDFAGEYSRMRARKIAIRRIPAILATITFELFVGLVIAQYNGVLNRVRALVLTKKEYALDILSSGAFGTFRKSGTSSINYYPTSHHHRTCIHVRLETNLSNCSKGI